MTQIDLSSLQHLVLEKKLYRQRRDQLQLDLMALQLQLYRSRRRAILVVEGPDAAGKGGFLRRALRYMDPRGVRVHAIGPPDAIEAGQHYLQRFWRRLPTSGQLCVFDRSWYGRILVEHVEHGYKERERACREIVEFERMLVDDQIMVVKLLFYIDKETQRNRLLTRLESPEKHWKITDADLNSFPFHHQYRQAYEYMLKQCSQPVPWQLVAANDKYHARVAGMEALSEQWRQHLGEPAHPQANAAFVARARRVLERRREHSND